MSLKLETCLARIFLFSSIGGITYLFGDINGPLENLYQRITGWVFVLILAVFGGFIGFAITYSIVLSFPQYKECKKSLLIAGTFGGAIFWAINSFGMFYFIGLIVFALALGLCGKTLDVKVRVMAGVLIGGLLGLTINSFPSDAISSLSGVEESRRFLASDLFKFYRLTSLFLEGYLTNLGLLLGIHAGVKLIWYGAVLGFVIMGTSTGFHQWGYVQVVIGTGLGAGIGYTLDWLFKKRENVLEKPT